jgi:hypothetical protein
VDDFLKIFLLFSRHVTISTAEVSLREVKKIARNGNVARETFKAVVSKLYIVAPRKLSKDFIVPPS